jgi:sugar/nucleoside kinase (ribokinase family)
MGVTVSSLALRSGSQAGFTQVVGVGGIGTGTIFALQGNHSLGRNESRMGAVIDARDYCKLHIVEHYIAVLLKSTKDLEAFKVFAVGNVGADAAGATLIREMTDVGIDTHSVRVESECRTMFSAVFLYPDKSGGNITASNSAASQLSSEQIADCRHPLSKAGPRGIALCLPEVPLDKRKEFLRVATESESYRVASFTSEEMKFVDELDLLANVDLLALNREEAIELAGGMLQEVSDEQLLDACAKAAVSRNPRMKILVSAGAAGAYVFQHGRWSKHEPVPTEPVSTAGAGDALLAGTIAGLAAGMPLAKSDSNVASDHKSIGSAIDLGLILAAFSVTSPHTIHPEATLESLLAFAETKGFLVRVQIATPTGRNV